MVIFQIRIKCYNTAIHVALNMLSNYNLITDLWHAEQQYKVKTVALLVSLAIAQLCNYSAKTAINSK